MAISTLLILIAALGICLGYEAVNGFHDTANAVATVIYTKSLRPQYAVVWSGLVNFLGVVLGGVAVAFSIVHLLPVDMLVHIDTGAGLAMVLALLARGHHLELWDVVSRHPGLQLAHADRRHHWRGPGQFLAGSGTSARASTGRRPARSACRC